MAGVEIYEDTLEVEVTALRPVDFETSQAAYPLPMLDVGDQRIAVTLRTVVLENPFLKVVTCPDFGGSVLGIQDKRTGQDIVPLPQTFTPEAGGERGVDVRWGLRVVTRPGHRMTETGRVEDTVREPMEEDQPGAVFLSEILMRQEASWTLAVTLPPDEASVILELRLANRTEVPMPLWSGLQLTLAGHQLWRSGGSYLVVTQAQAGHGFAATVEGGAVSAWSEGDVLLFASRGREAELLGPYGAETWRLRLTPFSDVPGVSVANRAGAMAVTETGVAVQAAQVAPDSKLFVLTGDGQTLEAGFGGVPFETARFETGSLPGGVRGLVWRNAARQEVLRWEPGVAHAVQTDMGRALPSPELEAARRAFAAVDAGAAVSDELMAVFAGFREGRVPGPVSGALAQGLRAVLQARASMGQGDWSAAAVALERAVGIWPESVTLWWARAACLRHGAGTIEGAEDDPGLTSAHYLDPLDPLLRAEGFLQIPPVEGKEPNPILRPLAANPDAALDVVCRLVEWGLTQDAARLIDELLRLREIPLLRLIYAWLLLTQSQMTAEAADQVRRAGTAFLEPPLPWRRIERAAVTRLAAEYPENGGLQTLLGWMN